MVDLSNKNVKVEKKKEETIDKITDLEVLNKLKRETRSRGKR